MTPTRLSCAQIGFPVCCRRNKEISQIIKQAVPEIHEGDEIWFGTNPPDTTKVKRNTKGNEILLKNKVANNSVTNVTLLLGNV